MRSRLAFHPICQHLHFSLELNKKFQFATLILLGALIFTIVPNYVFAVGDAVEGRKKAQSCLTCHRKGNIVHGEMTPIISGQYQDYLIKALKDYRSGARQHLIMNQLAVELSDQDIEDITAYYSQLNSRLSGPNDGSH